MATEAFGYSNRVEDTEMYLESPMLRPVFFGGEEPNV